MSDGVADFATVVGMGEKLVDFGGQVGGAAIGNGLAGIAERIDEILLAIDQDKSAGGKAEDRLVAVAVDEAGIQNVDGDRMTRQGGRQFGAERDVAGYGNEIRGDTGERGGQVAVAGDGSARGAEDFET